MAIVDADVAARAGWTMTDLAAAYLSGGARLLQVRAKNAASGWLLDIATADDPETTLATMKTLVRMMEEKTRFVQLLDDCITGAGLTVVIGTEHNDPELQRFSVVTSTYSSAGHNGAVGVIGPTRMRYSRAIDVVASLSRAIDRVLDKPEG